MDPSRSVALCYNAFLRRGRRIRNIPSSGWATRRVVTDSASSPPHLLLRNLDSSSPLRLLISTQAAAAAAVSDNSTTRRLSSRASPPRLQNQPHGRRRFSTLGGEDDDSDHCQNPKNPWRVAIVGSGPSGCYTAKYLLAGASKLTTTTTTTTTPSQSSLAIDVIERLPTPYGLVRNGVAPDHPEVKNVQNDFDALFEKDESDSEDENNARIGFYGNVTVGGSNHHGYPSLERGMEVSSSDVALEELRELYDIVVLAYGCESDRELDLPVDVLLKNGEIDPSQTEKASTVRGILSAREFVNWYNGHPDYDWVTHHVEYALQGKTSQNIVVVGHGNVALDCARILAKCRHTLDPTDLASRALNVLRPPPSVNNTNTNTNTNPIQRSISVVGRRGHVQAAFTIKEVRELTKLSETDDAQLCVRKDELEMGKSTEASQEELKARPRARIHKLLEGHSKKQQPKGDGAKDEIIEAFDTEVHLRFLTNPVRFQAKAENEERALRLSSVVCERTKLEGDIPGSQSATGTGSTEAIDADLCLVSIGYKGLPIDASTSASFDTQRGILQNDHGRVAVSDEENEGNNLAPLYVSGWLKRGPSGIIGTNIGDAKDTVTSILKDMKSGAISKSEPKSSSPLKDLLQERKVRFVDWEAYREIEDCESSETKSENALGHQKRHPDQPREKIVDREDLLRAANV